MVDSDGWSGAYAGSVADADADQPVNRVIRKTSSLVKDWST
jgi:hypothetical protein